jgi:hypothetical protein
MQMLYQKPGHYKMDGKRIWCKMIRTNTAQRRGT